MNKEEYKRLIKMEKELYIGKCTKLQEIRLWLLREHPYMRWCYVKTLRYCEYLNSNLCVRGGISDTMKRIYLAFFRSKKNLLGIQLNIEIAEGITGSGLVIYHNGVVINGAAKIGKNCRLHGMNCIGNKGDMNRGITPVLEDDVEIGFGAGIFGNVHIPQGCRIGAGAVVVSSPPAFGSVVVGIPAKVKNPAS